MRVTYHESAAEELAQAVRFYNDRSEGLGNALVAEVRNAAERVEAHRDIGTSVRPGIRRLLLRRFPYSILYRVSGESLQILAVMHHRRRPSPWRDG